MLHVPADYPTIQAALDSVFALDSVMVMFGEYPEALIAPQTQFWLIGDVQLDTGDFARPVVDASLISVSRGCMTAPAGSYPIVERIRFRNRFDMSHRADCGGVKLNCEHADFTHCTFDSTYFGILQIPGLRSNVSLSHCDFRWNNGPYAALGESKVIVDHCHFTGNGSFWQLIVGDSSVVEFTVFEQADETLLSSWGTFVTIRDCVFGPSGPHQFYPIVLSAFTGIFEDNLVTDLLLTGPALAAEINCMMGAMISGNTFVACRRVPNSGATVPVHIYCDGHPDDRGYEFLENIVTACSSYFNATAIWAEGRGYFTRNRLHDPGLRRDPAVYVENSSEMVFHENLIYNNGIGMMTESGQVVDARFNWWGDSSGPYHATLNPDGRGDQIGNNILFEPWLIDTLESAESGHEHLVPSAYSLSVYPNPFNLQTRIRFTVPVANIYTLDLFDLLGRRVQEIYHGPSIFAREINFDAGGLASGVYFIRAAESFTGRPLVTQKLVLMR